MWRRSLRHAARAAELRISVRRVHDLVFIEHVDHVVTDDVLVATARVVGAGLFGDEEAVTYDEALKAAKRQRLRVVRDENSGGDGD